MQRALGHRQIANTEIYTHLVDGALEEALDRAEHYKRRTVVERFNPRLKDEFGGEMVRVRGHRKVHAHLMFGLLVIFADQVLRLGA